MSLRSILLKTLSATAALIGGAILLVLLIYGIGTSIVIPFKSAKDDVAFKQIIGTSYRLTEDFQVLGITDDLNRRNLAYQLIYPACSVGFSNRYVIHRRKMAEGTVLKLTDVLVSEWPTVAPGIKYILSTKDEHFQLDENWFKEEHLMPIHETMPNPSFERDSPKAGCPSI